MTVTTTHTVRIKIRTTLSVITRIKVRKLNASKRCVTEIELNTSLSQVSVECKEVILPLK